MVDLLRTLTNRQVGIELRRVAEALAGRLDAEAPGHSIMHQPRPQLRTRPGAVERAVLAVLQATDHPLQVRELHNGTCKWLDKPGLSYSSTKNAASRLARSPTSSVRRVGLGVYTC